MNDNRLRSIVEAILIVAEEPLSAQELGAGLEVPPYLIEETLEELQREYDGQGKPPSRVHGFSLRKHGDGWRFYSNPEFANEISSFISGHEQTQLSQAALETLAIVAYRQPVSRAQIASVRGVNVDSVVRSLVSRGLIVECDVSPTGANLYGTTRSFLEIMGMETLDDLVPLAPLLPDVASIDSLTIELEEQE